MDSAEKKWVSFSGGGFTLPCLLRVARERLPGRCAAFDAGGQRRQHRVVAVPEAADALQRMKFEIAQEFGVELGPDTTARANGSVGGEMVNVS